MTQLRRWGTIQAYVDLCRAQGYFTPAFYATALAHMERIHVRRRHRWVVLFSSVVVSGHTTLILHTLWDGWPLARDLQWLVFFVVNALGGLGWLAWGLRGLRAEEAIDRRWTLQDARWRAQSRAWRQEGDEQEPLRAG
jgi:hypothetical protein